MSKQTKATPAKTEAPAPILAQLIDDVRSITCNGSTLRVLVFKENVIVHPGAKDKLLPILGQDLYTKFVANLKEEIEPDGQFPTPTHMQQMVTNVGFIRAAAENAVATTAEYNTAMSMSQAVFTTLWDTEIYAALPVSAQAQPTWDDQVDACVKIIVGDDPATEPADVAVAAAALASANNVPVNSKAPVEQTAPAAPPKTDDKVQAEASDLPATTGNPVLEAIVANIRTRASSLKATAADIRLMEEALTRVRDRQDQDQQNMLTDLQSILDAVATGSFDGKPALPATVTTPEEEVALAM